MSANARMLAVVAIGLFAGSEARAQCTPHTINVDGQSGDWTGLFQFLDVNEPAFPDGQDLRIVYLTNDASYLYVAFETFATTTGVAEAEIYLDLPPLNPTSFGSEDRVLRIRFNNNSCQSLAVTNTGGGGNYWPAGTCYRNYARVGSFTEVRVPLSVFSLSACPRLGVAVQLQRRSGGSNDISPGAPWPTFMPYDNSGTLTPTLARFRSVFAEVMGGGVLVRWETVAEWDSLGTRVLREKGPGRWIAVGDAPPSPAPTGGRQTLFDPRGRLGDRYRVVETDLSGAVSEAGPVTARGPAPSLRSVGASMSLIAAPVVAREPGQEAKVRVTEEGPVLLCAKALSSLGWMDSEAPVVTREGQPVPVFRVGERFAGCDGFVFWARAPRSPHARFETYRVRPVQDGEALPLLVVRPGNLPAVREAAFRRVAVADLWPDQTVPDLERAFLGYVSQPFTLALPMPDRVEGDRVEVDLESREFFGRTAGLRLAVDGVPAGEVGAGGAEYAAARFRVLPSSSAPVLVFSLGTAGRVVTLSGLSLRYPARLVLKQPSVTFEVDEAGWYSLDWGGQPFAALEVTSESARPLEAIQERSLAAVECTQAGRVAVFSAQALRSPSLEALGPRLDTFPNAEYLVLASESLVPHLRPLLNARAAQGLKVAGVALESVYDRFSGSQPSPLAVTAFLAWARQGAVPPRWLLLVGSTSYDPRGRTPQRPADAPVLPTLFPELRLRTLSDPTLVSDGAGVPQVALGRLPTSDPAEIDRYVLKVLDWEGRAPVNGLRVFSGAQQSSRDPDFAAVADVLAGTAGGVSSPLPDATALGLEWAQAGVVAYVGHSATTFWNWVAGGPGVTATSVDLPSARVPVVLSAGCQDAGPTSLEMGMAFGMVSAPSGRGAIAYVGQSGLGDPNQAAGVLNALLLSRARTWGEAWLDAVRSVPNASGYSSIFVGDPALPRVPFRSLEWERSPLDGLSAKRQ